MFFYHFSFDTMKYIAFTVTAITLSIIMPQIWFNYPRIAIDLSYQWVVHKNIQHVYWHSYSWSREACRPAMAHFCIWPKFLPNQILPFGSNINNQLWLIIIQECGIDEVMGLYLQKWHWLWTFKYFGEYLLVIIL